MKFWLRKKKRLTDKAASVKMEMLVRMGRNQFKEMIAKGISIPVALL